MSEEDVRGGMRDAVAEEPPLDFDPDVLVAAARQQVRRRRALMGVGVATVAVAVAAVALPVALGRLSSQVEAGQGPATTTESTATGSETSPSPSRIQWPAKDVTPVQFPIDKLRARGTDMAAHLREIMPSVLPNASEIEVSEFGGEATGEYYEGQTNVNGAIDFTIDGVRYSILVQTWVPGGANDLVDTACSEGTCRKIGEQDGGVLMAVDQDLGGFVAGGKISAVYHLRRDGAAVEAAAYNYALSGGPKLTKETIPVSVEQLRRLATDTELGL
ncbi:hypothetical protein [Actinophytocola sp.]|uniref:hypothetical protein n=1 Tax=Actinophytocola sp. TaxID=1872138 RepID=UPI002D4C2D46|nr:hypothetical protein [Actinophytocola sp.]HYQ64314.1 hypothetical protein [Actinophytocola sp.]